jgi:hypothetical protein
MKVYRKCPIKTEGRKTNTEKFCVSECSWKTSFKRNIRGQQNSNLIVGSQDKYDKMKLFPAVT